MKSSWFESQDAGGISIRLASLVTMLVCLHTPVAGACRVIRNHRSGRCIYGDHSFVHGFVFRPTFLSLVFSSTSSNTSRAGEIDPPAAGSALSALTPGLRLRNVASRDPRLGPPHTQSCPTTRERTRDHRTSHARDTFDIFCSTVSARMSPLPSHRPATSE